MGETRLFGPISRHSFPYFGNVSGCRLLAHRKAEAAWRLDQSEVQIHTLIDRPSGIGQTALAASLNFGISLSKLPQKAKFLSFEACPTASGRRCKPTVYWAVSPH